MTQDPALVSEVAVLGAVVQSAEDAGRAVSLLAAENFRDRAHRVVFAAVARLADAGHPVQVPSVIAELGPDLARVGSGDCRGAEYVRWLAAGAGDVGYHAPRVLAAWQQREAVRLLDQARALAAAPGWDPAVTPERVRELAGSAAVPVPGAVPLPSACDLVNEVIGGLEDPVSPGLGTGLPDLDEVTGGMGPGEVFVVGAVTGMGKTAVGLTVADHVGTVLGLPVLYSSLEMPAARLTCHRVAAAAGVALPRILRHDLDGDDAWDRIGRAHPVLASSALLIDDTPGVSVAHVRGRLRGMARAGTPARLWVADYLQLMEAPAAENRQAAVAALMLQVQRAARDHDVPVLVLAQLNRAPGGRPDKLPHLSDFRESAAIENTADVAVLLHREDYYEAHHPRAGEMDLLVRKNRKGPPCTVTVAFQGHYGRVVSMAPDYSQPPRPPRRRGRPDPAVAREMAEQDRRDDLAARRASREGGSL